jgi:hypothetical protein
MIEPAYRMVDGELVELLPEDIEQRTADTASALISAKAQRTEAVAIEANRRVMNALPDLDLAQSIRAYQADLAALIASKQKLHTLAAIDIMAGWPE